MHKPSRFLESDVEDELDGDPHDRVGHVMTVGFPRTVVL